MACSPANTTVRTIIQGGCAGPGAVPPRLLTLPSPRPPRSLHPRSQHPTPSTHARSQPLGMAQATYGLHGSNFGSFASPLRPRCFASHSSTVFASVQVMWFVRPRGRAPSGQIWDGWAGRYVEPNSASAPPFPMSPGETHHILSPSEIGRAELACLERIGIDGHESPLRSFHSAVRSFLTLT